MIAPRPPTSVGRGRTGNGTDPSPWGFGLAVLVDTTGAFVVNLALQASGFQDAPAGGSHEVFGFVRASTDFIVYLCFMFSASEPLDL